MHSGGWAEIQQREERCSYAGQYYHRDQETALLCLVIAKELEQWSGNMTNNSTPICEWKKLIGRNTETFKKEKQFLQFGG